MTDDDAPSAAGGGCGIAVTVDHGSCSGTAHCQQSMPEVFVVIDRKSHIRPGVDWTTVDRKRLHETVDGCPWFAITATMESD